MARDLPGYVAVVQAASQERLSRLLPLQPASLEGSAAPEVAAGVQAQREGMSQCSIAADAPVVLYVAKMIAVPAGALPR